MPTNRLSSLTKISGFLLCSIPLLFIAACSLQDSMVYHPQPYPFPREAVPPKLQALEFKTSQGAQQAYYAAPRSGKLTALWVLFPGNGGSALGWHEWVEQYPDGNTGFLLVDYPGYGHCEGRPSAKAILESSEQAFATLAANLGIDQTQLWGKTSLLGHSLGAAEALQFAARHDPQRVVLVAPFTTLRAIGKEITGPVIGSLVVNEYDNVARVKEMEGRPIHIHVVHGANDELIPASFGRELANAAPDISYEEVPGAHHNDVLELGRPAIYRAMGHASLAAWSPVTPEQLMRRR